MQFSFDELFPHTKTVGLFGIGRSNGCLCRFIPEEKQIIIRSESKINRSSLPKRLKSARIYEGVHAFDRMHEDILFLSPSVRRQRHELDPARERGICLCSDLELFLKVTGSEIIGISGSDGKSTTATLTSRLILPRYGGDLLGNIGTPFTHAFGKKSPALSVLELSSFQLSYSAIAARRAALTNITPNHLNWHESFNEYKEVKLSLLESATEAVISADDDILCDFGRSRQLFAVTSYNIPYTELRTQFRSDLFITAEGGSICKNGEPKIALSSFLRREEHNIKNFMTAMALAEGYTTDSRTEKLASSFKGLTHRCRCIAEFAGVRFIDSSIDTTPARTAQTLKSISQDVIIILGGRGKCTGYSELCEPLSRHAKLAVITGENRDDILADIGGSTATVKTDSFEDAVLYAASVAKPEDIVLLSPASASYDAFSSFEKRGEKFKEIILDFIEKQQKQRNM